MPISLSVRAESANWPSLSLELNTRSTKSETALREKSVRVLEAASRDYANFYRAFKSEYGISPRAFAAQAGTGSQSGLRP